MFSVFKMEKRDFHPQNISYHFISSATTKDRIKSINGIIQTFFMNRCFTFYMCFERKTIEKTII